ncbi:MAG: glycosyltransferase family 2 protein [Bacteroidales bacterium]|jgi:glycosyltransferase involved in cell wall biosynthesis|nr:glycosyltransferase family 2 protein [Bacteroidales bacterium]MDD4215143.1 glycosyltransferase family 2 protein [Bacteroidales bacterium]
MLENNSLTVIIPAFNEAENLKIILPPLIKLCEENNWKIILVDDGSTDKTKEVLSTYNNHDLLKLIHHKLNKGYGAAIKSGILACETEYIITIDADGQHNINDITNLFTCLIQHDTDMVVGSRKGLRSASFSRRIGKSLIRTIAKILMNVPVHDLNSGMKTYRSDLARKYINLAPDTMSFSDIITLIFISNRHLVMEEPITVTKRLKGKSTIRIDTAFHTIMEVINIVILFNPMKIFLPLSLICLLAGFGVGLPLLLNGQGISTGSLLGIFAGIIFFLLGLIAEQLSLIRRNQSK